MARPTTEASSARPVATNCARLALCSRSPYPNLALVSAGQLDDERAPRTASSLHVNRAAVALDDPSGDRKSKAAARLAALKSLEKGRESVFFNSRPAVLDCDRWTAGAAVHSQLYFRSTRAHSAPIVDQVCHSPSQQLFVCFDAPLSLPPPPQSHPLLPSPPPPPPPPSPL